MSEIGAPALTASRDDPAEPPLSHRAIMVVLVPLIRVLFIAALDQTSAPWIAASCLLTSAVSTRVLGKAGDIFLAGSLLSQEIREVGAA